MIEFEFHYGPAKTPIIQQITEALSKNEAFALKTKRNVIVFDPQTCSSFYQGRPDSFVYKNMDAFKNGIGMHLAISGVEFINITDASKLQDSQNRIFRKKGFYLPG